MLPLPRGLPIWAFHGGEDTVVLPSESQGIVESMQREGARPRPKLTIYPGVGHNSWTRTYDDPRVYVWMLKQKKAFVQGA